jgi:hypothetical protein
MHDMWAQLNTTPANAVMQMLLWTMKDPLVNCCNHLLSSAVTANITEGDALCYSPQKGIPKGLPNSSEGQNQTSICLPATLLQQPAPA